MGRLQEPWLVPQRAGESTPHMAEQLAFQQLGRERPAMDRNKRAGAAQAGGVQGVGDQLLSGSGRTKHQHADTRWPQPADHVAEPLHRRGSANQAEIIRALPLPQLGQLGLEPRFLQGSPDHDQQHVGIDWLGQEIPRATFGRL